MLQLECLTSQVRYVAERHTTRLRERAVLAGFRSHKRTVDLVVARCVALGMEAFREKHRVLIIPGTCDVDAWWAKARRTTREEIATMQLSAGSFILHERYRRARVADAARRRAERVASSAEAAEEADQFARLVF